MEKLFVKHPQSTIIRLFCKDIERNENITYFFTFTHSSQICLWRHHTKSTLAIESKRLWQDAHFTHDLHCQSVFNQNHILLYFNSWTWNHNKIVNISWQHIHHGIWKILYWRLKNQLGFHPVQIIQLSNSNYNLQSFSELAPGIGQYLWYPEEISADNLPTFSASVFTNLIPWQQLSQFYGPLWTIAYS